MTRITVPVAVGVRADFTLLELLIMVLIAVQQRGRRGKAQGAVAR